MIPRVAHFVFGLREQREPFHFLHYVSLESCRRVLEPEVIVFHHWHLPWGPWWELIQPHLTLRAIDQLPAEVPTHSPSGRVPPEYRYAHQADFIRLDALISDGGVYADIDTLFLRPLPDGLFQAPFVIGQEPPVVDQITHERRPSLCNALLMAEPGSQFARAWREQMPAALNDTWSNHSGFLAQRLSTSMPDQVRVEPEVSFYPVDSTPQGLAGLLTRHMSLPTAAYTVHLWAHLWWSRGRIDLSRAHAGWYAPPLVRAGRTTLAELTRPYLPPDPPRRPAPRRSTPAQERWSYLSLDESSGYGIAADRCMSALLESGLELEWMPFVIGRGWGLGYQPAVSEPLVSPGTLVVVSHLVAEYLPLVRRQIPGAFLVGHTVWDTDRLPRHWVPALEHADLVVVPSRFSADAMTAEPLTTPVAVVPHTVGADLKSTGVVPPRDVPDDVLVFYTIGEWTERKDIERTVQAFLTAFTGRDRVMLIIKTSPFDRRLGPRFADPGMAATGSAAAALARVMAGHPEAPEVRLITRDLTEAEIAGLHARGDCFVSLCRGEGWGLGAFDAATRGNPVVITGYGGQLEYLHGSELLVSYELVPVCNPAGGASYTPDQRWAQADVGHGAELLRQLAGNYPRAQASAQERARELCHRYRPEAVADAFRAAVNAFRCRAGRSHEEG